MAFDVLFLSLMKIVVVCEPPTSLQRISVSQTRESQKRKKRNIKVYYVGLLI